MSSRLLTIDLGNSRCKLRVWSTGVALPPAPTAAAEFSTDVELATRVTRWLSEHPLPDAAAISSVASVAIEGALARALAAVGIPTVDRQPDPGLDVAVRKPELVGRDRLFAARGAFECVRGSAIVVDAGTALTVDAICAMPMSRRGRFLGGAIGPGPRLLADALERGTARLPHIDPEPAARALGRDTIEALQAGVVIGFQGAARELVRRISSEAALVNAPVVLTGGARRFLTVTDWLGAERSVVEVPDLVHLGLCAACAIEPREIWSPT